MEQPIFTKFSPSQAKEVALNFEQFITLLRSEEDYWPGEQHNTFLMTTRLRKIFYDRYGWNSELIRGTENIEGRYAVTLVPDTNPALIKKTSGGLKHNNGITNTEHMHRMVTVKAGDWMNPNVGSVPEIYANDNQEIITPMQWYADMGHVLAGMDASNYLQPVSPLPSWLMFLRRLGPSVDKNTDCATWLGDLSSVAGEFLFHGLAKKRKLTDQEKQEILNAEAPGSDMLGNIDSIVIPMIYNLKTNHGLRVTDILTDYYSSNGMGHYFLQRRCRAFCTFTGLKGWNGSAFENEKQWLRYQTRQLRCTTAFYAFTAWKKPKAIFMALGVWLHFFEKRLELKHLLSCLLGSLKNAINNEPEL